MLTKEMEYELSSSSTDRLEELLGKSQDQETADAIAEELNYRSY
mgnify:CR=1 FL=1